MNTNRITLSSSVFEGRVRKFDTYTPTQNRPAKKPATVAPRPQNAHSSASARAPSQPSGAGSIPLGSGMAATLPTAGSRVAASSSIALQAVSASPASGHVADFEAPEASSVFDKFVDLSLPTSGQAKVRKPRMGIMQTGMYAVGVFVFGFAMLVSVQTMISNKQAKQQIQEVLGETSAAITLDDEGVPQGTGSQPAEKEVSAAAILSYTIMNPEAPRYLRIPELGIFSRIKQLGEKDGAIDAPWNINDVGWYDGSAKPGNSKGASLLLGHVSGYSEPGVFKKIGDLGAGTRFEVEKGSGEKVVYEVTRTESIPVETLSMASILSPEVEGEHDLKLMTCSGKYNADTKQYEERLVVYAKIIR